MKLILHIGTHKTGTTAIQSYLHAHRKLLIKAGILYPSCCKDVNQEQFSFLVPLIRKGDDEELASFVSTIKIEAKSCNANSIVLSGEDLSLLSAEHVKKLAEFLTGFDVSVVIYFRNVYDHLISTFAQINRLNKSLPAWSNLGERLHGLMDYDSILSKWCEVFGADNISAHSYDKNKDTLLQHFIEHIGLTKELSPSLFKQTSAVRFQNSNAKFDPTLELFLVLIGYSHQYTDFDRARKIYQKHFGDKMFTRNNQLILARAFLRSRQLRLTHPKLLPFRKELSPQIDINEQHSNTEVGEFMITMGDVLKELGRSKKRDDIKGYVASRMLIDRIMRKLKSFKF